MMNAIMQQLNERDVLLEGLIFRVSTSFIGVKEGKNKASVQELAFYTVRTLARTVPAVVPGIILNFGGTPQERAIQNLTTISKIADQ